MGTRYRGGSNEYLQCMFWIKYNKNRYTPANPCFSNIKVGFEGVCISLTCFPDAPDIKEKFVDWGVKEIGSILIVHCMKAFS